MTYSVIWRLTAVQDLGRAEQAVDDPAAVRQAAADIDYRLRRGPREVGESRDPDIRVWYGAVLGVRYRIDEAANTVVVLSAAPARRR
jgi:hypothetical protein